MNVPVIANLVKKCNAQIVLAKTVLAQIVTVNIIFFWWLLFHIHTTNHFMNRETVLNTVGKMVTLLPEEAGWKWKSKKCKSASRSSSQTVGGRLPSTFYQHDVRNPPARGMVVGRWIAAILLFFTLLDPHSAQMMMQILFGPFYI